MCGIAGIAGIENPEILHQMCVVMRHRGPDDKGYYSGRGRASLILALKGAEVTLAARSYDHPQER